MLKIQIQQSQFHKTIHPAYLGIGLLHAWLQISFYNSYKTIDGDSFSIVMNFVRCFVMLLAILYLVWARSNQLVASSYDKAQEQVGLQDNADNNGAETTTINWHCIGFIGMIFASIAMAIGLYFNIEAVYRLGGILAAVSIVPAAGLYASLYASISLPEAFIYSFLSIILGSSIGLVSALLPRELSLLFSAFLPIAGYLSFRATPHMRTVSSRRAQFERLRSAKTFVFSELPYSAFLPALFAVAVFGFALGATRAYPMFITDTFPMEFTLSEQIWHRLGVIGFSLLLLIWVLKYNKMIKFQPLWGALVAIVSTSALLLSVHSGLTQAALVLATIANSIALAVLWFALSDISHHLRVLPGIIFALGWLVYMLARNIGRLVVMRMIEAQLWGINSEMFIVVLIYLSSVSLIFILGDRIGGVRPLFHGLATELGSLQDERLAPKQQTDTMRNNNIVSIAEAYKLSPREQEVLRLLLKAYSKSAAAEAMGITENTIRGYSKSLYKKLEVHSKAELIELVDNWPHA